MSSNKYESLANLKPGRYDYKIKVRVIRFWRVFTRTGEELKCFNVMLLDNKKNRIHAFAPIACADQHEYKLKVGNVCIIKNITVQPYKADEKFRCLRNDNQLIFTKDTKIEEIEDKGLQIAQDHFDFYEHSELISLSKQTTYLADVVGIIKSNFKGVNNVHNRLGKDQCQAKFTITDGQSNIKVTFWDRYAELFDKAMSDNLEQPVIVIIASCKVGLWNTEVDISNVGPTKFYLNYNHHSVVHMRKLLKKPEFCKHIFETTLERKKTELLTIADVKTLGKEAIDIQVLTHVHIQTVLEKKIWFSNYCTTCQTKTEMADEHVVCSNCNRIVPHPEKRFEVSILACDTTGGIEIVLGDQQVRILTGKRARQLLDKKGKSTAFPEVLKNLANKDYTIKLQIKEMNVLDKIEVYWATNICNGFKLEEEDTSEYKDEMLQTTTQATTSTYHLQGMSDLNCQSS